MNEADTCPEYAPPRPRTLEDLQSSITACRRCADAHYLIGSTPIFTLNPAAVFMTIGQAPGRHEAEMTHRPFSGPAGKRLFRWLAQAGFDEASFRATQAMTAVTKCYPGPHPAGRGDRVPTRAEQTLCAAWLEQEIALVKPRVLIPIGGLAIERLLANGKSGPALPMTFPLPAGPGPAGSQGCHDRGRIPPRRIEGLRMTELIGERFERDGGAGRAGTIIVPLPHPSGASGWFNAPENKARLMRALEILAELRAQLLDAPLSS